MGINIEHLEKMEKATNDRISETLRSVAETIVKVACEFPSITGMWLFGSIVGRRWNPERSDVDIAVEGLSWEEFGILDCRLIEALDRDFDLVPMEHASTALKTSIELTGKRII